MYKCFVFGSSREQNSRLFSSLGIIMFWEAVKILTRGFDTRLGNGIIRPLAVLAPIDDAAVAEYLHVVRERRLGDVHFLQQLARALLAAFKYMQYLNAVFIAERLKDGGNAFYIKLHLFYLTFVDY